MIRTRFAPSPTGQLHIGGVRTALFAWLHARQNNGTFLLRIEDTDQARFVEGAEAQIVEALEWLGINIDEGPSIGGAFGPYRQSERLESYMPYALKLIEEGKAYADPTSSEELEKLRESAKAEKRPFRYREHRPANPPAWVKGMPIRLKIDATLSPDWVDEIRGHQKGTAENIDDFILIKADGFPTYNFAHIIDDHEMDINLIVRGDEFMSSMPKFLLLYEALGFDTPKFAHVPAILGEQGTKKLSKRDGDVDTLLYREKGYLPEAMMSFLATLGWNDGTEQEIYTQAELIEKFSFERVQKSPARYDLQRLNWVNGNFIRKLSVEDLSIRLQNLWPDSAAGARDETKKQIVEAMQEKLKTLPDFTQAVRFFFETPDISLEEVLQLDKQLRKKLDTKTAQAFISETQKAVAATDFDQVSIEHTLRTLVDTLETNPGILFKLIRISVTGSTVAPGLFETLSILGKDEVIKRLSRLK